MLNWANEDVETYASDFSAGTDGFTAARVGLSGNIDGIGGQDDTLRAYGSDVSGTHTARSSSNLAVKAGCTYTLTYKIYLPSGNTTCDRVQWRTVNNSQPINSGASETYVTTTDTWVAKTFTFTATADTDVGLYLQDGTSYSSVVFANLVTDDLVYLKDVSFTQLTSNAYATTWYDQSGSHNDATQTTADNQPKVVDAGALVTDANGNYSLDFDGVDDALFMGGASAFDLGSATTVVIAQRSGSLSIDRGIFAPSISTNNDRWYCPIIVSSLEYFGYGSDALAISAGAGDTDVHIWTMGTFGSNVEGYRDGSLSGSVSATESGSTQGASGEIGIVVAGLNFNGKLASILWYPTDQSANRSAIEQSLSNTITTALS
jgi:hypothetical protein